MDERIVTLLCDPVTLDPLELTTFEDHQGIRRKFLFNKLSGRRFPFVDGIPVFADLAGASSTNSGARLFDGPLARGMDLAERAYYRLTGNKEWTFRTGYLDEVEIRPGARVLEVSIGTGADIRLLPTGVDYFGIDSSLGTLRQCRRNLRKWDLHAALFLGEAERLPFRAGTFDAVFHFGGVRLFSDRLRAIREMVRVAKPATRIVIADRTEQPVLHAGKPVRRIQLVPPGMQDVKTRQFDNGRFYCLSFRTPSLASVQQK